MKQAVKKKATTLGVELGIIIQLIGEGLFLVFRDMVSNVKTLFETRKVGENCGIDHCDRYASVIENKENTRAFRRGMNPTTHSTVHH